MARTTDCTTDYLASHGIQDAKYHLMPAKYAEAIFVAADSGKGLRWAMANKQLRCHVERRQSSMHTSISPKRVQLQDATPEQVERLCGKCASHIG
jgi:hypothetical protein